ncbi:hypothetical protein V8G54_016815 [Vigna mungo]|uniref:Uncharacterized protein n=1 Tax=Vigna mungo TaxID=3915 RepID=A0AAQ3NKU9_VIGMU
MDMDGIQATGYPDDRKTQPRIGMHSNVHHNGQDLLHDFNNVLFSLQSPSVDDEVRKDVNPKNGELGWIEYGVVFVISIAIGSVEDKSKREEVFLSESGIVFLMATTNASLKSTTLFANRTTMGCDAASENNTWSELSSLFHDTRVDGSNATATVGLGFLGHPRFWRVFGGTNSEQEIESEIEVLLKKSISFLLKKMFVCRNGFSPIPSLRDTLQLQESRMKKVTSLLDAPSSCPCLMKSSSKANTEQVQSSIEADDDVGDGVVQREATRVVVVVGQNPTFYASVVNRNKKGKVINNTPISSTLASEHDDHNHSCKPGKGPQRCDHYDKLSHKIGRCYALHVRPPRSTTIIQTSPPS